MTIKGLWKFYKDNVREETILVYDLKGKYVSLDAFTILIYELRCPSLSRYLDKIDPFNDPIDDDEVDKIWYAGVIDRLCKYMTDGFMPICVFDGDKDPLKEGTLGKRSDERQKSITAYEKLKKTYKGKGILEIPESAITKGRKHLAKMDPVPYKRRDKLIQFIKEIGVPWAVSLFDAERTCSAMNVDGLVYAVFSQDSDCMACGCKLLLRERTTVTKNRMAIGAYKVARLEPLLNALDMEFDLFQELCIMSGTDFNNNIPGISWNKSMGILQKYGSISLYGKNGKGKIDILNHREVRKRFKVVPWEDTVSSYSIAINPNVFIESELAKKKDIERIIDSMTNWKDTYGDVGDSRVDIKNTANVDIKNTADVDIKDTSDNHVGIKNVDVDVKTGENTLESEISDDELSEISDC